MLKARDLRPLLVVLPAGSGPHITSASVGLEKALSEKAKTHCHAATPTCMPEIVVANGLVVSWPWSDAIMDGIKSIETREYALPAELVGSRIALIETGNPNAENGAASHIVVGSVVFFRSDQYMEQDEWEDDTNNHLVAAGICCTH